MLPHSTDEYQIKSSEKMKNSLSKIEFKEKWQIVGFTDAERDCN